MGIIYSLELINPEVLKYITEVFQNKTDANSINWVKQLYLERNVEMVGYLEKEYEEILEENNKNSMSTFLKENFDNLIVDKSWDLDKSLDRGGLEKVIAIVPEMKELKILTEFDGFDINLPNIFKYFEAGIVGIWSFKKLSTCLDAINRFSSKEEILNYKKLLDTVDYKNKDKIIKICDVWVENYPWNNWVAIREAIIESVTKKFYLGLGMC